MVSELETKYLQFNLIEQKPKTNVYEVINKLHGFRLGIIKWYGAWRCYAFFPENQTLFNSGCMNDIVFFIDKITKLQSKVSVQ